MKRIIKIKTKKMSKEENLNISDVSDSFSRKQLKDVATKFAEWILNKDWEMTDLSDDKKMKTTSQLFDDFIKNYH
tara:strand:- start:121 stop:345 length:225 start_codon:yes stop_codon:yes gene_type:complete